MDDQTLFEFFDWLEDRGIVLHEGYDDGDGRVDFCTVEDKKLKRLFNLFLAEPAADCSVIPKERLAKPTNHRQEVSGRVMEAFYKHSKSAQVDRPVQLVFNLIESFGYVLVPEELVDESEIGTAVVQKAHDMTKKQNIVSKAFDNFYLDAGMEERRNSPLRTAVNAILATGFDIVGKEIVQTPRRSIGDTVADLWEKHKDEDKAREIAREIVAELLEALTK